LVTISDDIIKLLLQPTLQLLKSITGCGCLINLSMHSSLFALNLFLCVQNLQENQYDSYY